MLHIHVFLGTWHGCAGNSKYISRLYIHTFLGTWHGSGITACCASNISRSISHVITSMVRLGTIHSPLICSTVSTLSVQLHEMMMIQATSVHIYLAKLGQKLIGTWLSHIDKHRDWKKKQVGYLWQWLDTEIASRWRWDSLLVMKPWVQEVMSSRPGRDNSISKKSA